MVLQRSLPEFPEVLSDFQTVPFQTISSGFRLVVCGVEVLGLGFCVQRKDTELHHSLSWVNALTYNTIYAPIVSMHFWKLCKTQGILRFPLTVLCIYTSKITSRYRLMCLELKDSPAKRGRLFACVNGFSSVYINRASTSFISHCIVSHQRWLISCFDPVCLHVPPVDGDDDRCFKWHFSANNLLSYWFPAQISSSVLFQQMDFVPCCPSPHQSSFPMFLYFIENLTWAFRIHSLL